MRRVTAELAKPSLRRIVGIPSGSGPSPLREESTPVFPSQSRIRPMFVHQQLLSADI